VHRVRDWYRSAAAGFDWMREARGDQTPVRSFAATLQLPITYRTIIFPSCVGFRAGEVQLRFLIQAEYR